MWKRLETWNSNFQVGMTKEKYLNLCEQIGEYPKEEKCPPGFEDFPVPLQQAIEVFNRLGDRVYPEIGYMGKDYTALPIHMRVVDVQSEDIFLEALVRLDGFMIQRSAEQLKRARESAKKGHGK